MDYMDYGNRNFYPSQNHVLYDVSVFAKVIVSYYYCGVVKLA